MPSKRNSTATSSREPSDSAKPGAQPPETHVRSPRPAPAPRAPRGAAAIPAPRKAEVHRLVAAHRPLPTREQVAARAYEIWVHSGCVAGHDAENWLQAERELQAGCS
jgi:hypothetical protein